MTAKTEQDLPGDLEWWQQTVIYHVYPRSFQDSTGDGTGDIKGIQSRLDHFVNLGIGAVWLSPVYKSPMVDFGYDISDFNDIDPIFGTLQDFKELVTEMHKRNIKLIMDFIPNHSSDQHKWFQKSIIREEPFTDYYTWKDPSGWDNSTKPLPTPLPPNNWVSVFGGSMWTWNPIRKQFYLHQFAKEQPDLRFENPRVRKEMYDSMHFWLDLGVDGFRMDAVPHLFEDQSFPNASKAKSVRPGTLPTEYDYWDSTQTFDLPEVLIELRRFRELLDNNTRKSGQIKVMMTEGYVVPIPNLMKYYGTSQKPIAHFPFNFEFIRIGKEFTAPKLKSVIDTWMNALPKGTRGGANSAWPNWLAGNHDNSRVASRLGPQFVDAVNMIVLLLPGTATTYYGEEIGMVDRPMTWEETIDTAGCNAGPNRYHLFSRDPERTPMQWNSNPNAGFSITKNKSNTWLPVHENYTKINVEMQLSAKQSHLKVYKGLVGLRKTNAWKFGILETRVLENGNVFGFTRVYKTEGLLALANLGSTQARIDCTKFNHIVQNTNGTVLIKSVGFSKKINKGSNSISLRTVELQPYESIVLTFEAEAMKSKSNRFTNMFIFALLMCFLGFMIQLAIK